MGPLGANSALLGPSWSPPGAFLEPREGPLGAILGPLGQKHENDTKKGSNSSPASIDFWDHFDVILGLFSGSIFEPMFKQFLDPFCLDFWRIFG